VRRGGFWHWYRTHPGLVALFVVGLLLFAGLLVVTVLMFNRRLQMARIQAEAERKDAIFQAKLAEVRLRMQRGDPVELQDALDELQKPTYADRMQKAHQAWKNNGFAVASRHLEKADENSRGWEYWYLRRLLDAGPGAAECRTLPEHDSPVHAVGFSPDGRVLASADGSADRPGMVRLWDLDGQGEPRLLKGHAGLVSCLAFSPDGKRLATGSSDHSVKVWNVQSGEVQLSLAEHAGPVTSVAFSPNGKELVSVSWGTVKVWRADTGDKGIKLGNATGSYHSAAFSPDGRGLAAISLDGSVSIWTRRGGSIHKTQVEFQQLPAGAALWTVSICYRPDSRELAHAGAHTRVWELDKDGKPTRGHQVLVCGRSRTIVFSPDGERLATAGDDRAIRLWDPNTGKQLLCLTGHAGAVTSLAFSPDGRVLVSGSADGTVKVWEAAPAE
jgi:WD40 repeat protein